MITDHDVLRLLSIVNCKLHGCHKQFLNFTEGVS